ncbi:reverse transcriptase domain-containing protein [Tanacetum coccineum]
MYVDGGSSSEILYEHCFNRFRLEVKNQMVPATTPLVGFSGEIIWPLRQISLLVKICDEEHSTSAWMNFMVVRSPSPYNGIIGRPGVKRIRAVPSTAHGILKFLVTGRTVTLQSSRFIPLECIMVSGLEVPQSLINQVTEEKIKVVIHREYLEQTIAIGSTLTEDGMKELCGLLRRNLDIFAWKPADMTGVPWNIAEHRLNILEGCIPVRQKKKGQAPERNKAIYEEVDKLADAGIMKEVHYHSWLSNPVMVKKHDDGWRMRVDFKDLNKVYPKDGYPLPKIDWKVESLCGYPFKCFLDVYKGYLQIQMAKEDEEKKTFITSQGIFCYSKMPFGLKNTRATYQRLVDKAFQKQVGQNLEVYMDNLVIKIRTEQEVIRDIEETFKTLREINMKLNPKKCAIGMREGTFLGYKVNADGLRSGNQLHSNGKANTCSECPEDDSTDTPMEDKEELSDPWILFTDGLSCVNGSGAGLILTSPEGTEFTYALRFRFDATNNEAEYEALIAGLRIAKQMGVKNLQENVDSRLVANQVNETYIAKEPGMIKYLEKFKDLTSTFKEFSIKQNSRKKSIDGREVLAVVDEEGRTWMTLIYEYLTEEIILEEKRKERAIRRKAGRYAMTNGILYKSMHAGPRSVVEKALRSGYYRPTMNADARKLIRECSSYQIEAKPVAIITGAQIKKFVWDNIVCIFGLPGEIISDNKKQFRDNLFKDWSLGEGIKARHGETPFSLTYETEAALEINLDLLEERREQAAIQEAKSKAMIEKYYNARVRNISFRPGDIVYQNNKASRAKDGGKLGPKWEGPYEVTEALGKGAYKLKDHNGNTLSRT